MACESHAQGESGWEPLQRSYGAVWERSGLPDPPLDLRITNAAGQQVVARCARTESATLNSFFYGYHTLLRCLRSLRFMQHQ